MSDIDDFLKVLAEGKKVKKDTVAEVQQNLGDFLAAVAVEKSQDPKYQQLKEVKKHIQDDLGSLFSQLKVANVVPRPEPENNVSDGVVIQEDKFVDPVTLNEIVVPEIRPAAEYYSKAEIDDLLKHNASFQQPEPPKVDANIPAIQNKLKFLEQAIGRIAAAGPGGGEVNLRWLDDVNRSTIYDRRFLRYDDNTKKFVFDEVNTQAVVYETTIVTGPTYTAGLTDYYIGVNYAGPVTITLNPTPESGQAIYIKDESGHCSSHPITIKSDTDSIDNDPDGVILEIDNGGIHMIYRDGWRIV